jgi:hypothetical protein
MKKTEACLFCGKPATLLCDGHLGYPPAKPDQERRAYNGMDLLQPYTCDAPMCRECARLSASFILCRRGKGCIPDTVDYCPGCAAALAEEKQKKRPPLRKLINDPKQCSIIRASHWRTWGNGSALEAKDGGGQINLF